MGYSDEISISEYEDIHDEGWLAELLETVLTKHNKWLAALKHWDVCELLYCIKEMMPGFTYDINMDSTHNELPFDYKTGDYLLRGLICGEPVDAFISSEADSRDKNNKYTSAVEFIYDFINPLIKKKFEKEFICIDIGSDQMNFILIPSNRADRVRKNPFFRKEEYWKNILFGYQSAPGIDIH